MSWLQLAGSIVAVLALAGTAWALGLGQARIADNDAARLAAEAALPGFVAMHAVLDRDGRSALVYGADDGMAVLKLHGTHIAARRVSAVQVLETADEIRVSTGERWFGDVVVRL